MIQMEVAEEEREVAIAVKSAATRSYARVPRDKGLSGSMHARSAEAIRMTREQWTR